MTAATVSQNLYACVGLSVLQIRELQIIVGLIKDGLISTLFLIGVSSGNQNIRVGWVGGGGGGAVERIRPVGDRAIFLLFNHSK